MPTHRLLPPVTASNQTKVVNNRSYTAQPGSAIDVVSWDADMLSANGWIFVAMSGPTSARPTPTLSGAIGPEGTQAGPGTKFYDTTLGALIVCDGVTWRSPVDGSAV